SDHDFCALIEHELYHIGVERDQDDEIIYSDNTGLPKHYLAGHDVEEFYGVVRQISKNCVLTPLKGYWLMSVS
ncbi:MAG: putative metallopeptidase, partial [Acinetobacter sp.]